MPQMYFSSIFFNYQLNQLIILNINFESHLYAFTWEKNGLS